MANLIIPNQIDPTRSYSGLGQPFQDFAQQQVLPALGGITSDYPGYIQGAYQDAQRGLGQFTQNQLQPALQQNVNQLASRGILNSSVAGDALSKTLSGVAGTTQGLQAGLQGNQAAALAQAPSALGGLAGLGQYSQTQDPLEQYRLMASLIQGLQ